MAHRAFETPSQREVRLVGIFIHTRSGHVEISASGSSGALGDPTAPGWGQYPVHPTAAHPNPVVLVHGLADHVATAGGQRVLRLRNGLRPRPGYRPTAGRGSPRWADALVMGTG